MGLVEDNQTAFAGMEGLKYIHLDVEFCRWDDSFCESTGFSLQAERDTKFLATGAVVEDIEQRMGDLYPGVEVFVHVNVGRERLLIEPGQEMDVQRFHSKKN
jgi:hypothetical protein